ncbi:MarR family transcriptional regulator [Pelagibacterales bacterium SAG-MED15]|nr:MarR family transcriptional regulator [Pelagibacterales bacterium SAG-MED15]
MKDLLYLKDDHLKEFIEKIFVSYRESFNDAKKTLDKYSLGIAHHKVIHLLSVNEGIVISDLLKKLKITKQSLNRVIKDLKKFEIIEFKRGEKDSRLKHVFLTTKGIKISEEIFYSQKLRIYNALLSSTSNEVNNFYKVLKKIINEKI